MEFKDMMQGLLKSEGGFQNDPVDHGNWTGGKRDKGLNKGTKYGISAARYPELHIRALRKEEAIAIYKRDFFDAPGISKLPVHLQYVVFDHGVNCGVGRAVRLVQMLGNVPADGIIGPNTIAAAQRVTLAAYSEARRRYYRNLVDAWPAHQKYLRGWLRRVDATERETIAAVLSAKRTS